jgi:hypothetical protein
MPAFARPAVAPPPESQPMTARFVLRDRGTLFDAASAPENSRSCAFTSCIHLHDGSILVGFRNGTHRDAPDGRLRIMRTRDLGKSWETLHQGITAEVGGIVGNIYSGYFTELEPGHLIGVFVWVDRSNPELSFVNPVTAGVLPMRNLVTESFDGGETLSPFRLVDMLPHEGASCTGPIQKLPDGVLAMPYERWKEYDDTFEGAHSANFKLSSDGGQTWDEVVEVAGDDGGRRFYWDQRFAKHPETGDFVAMFWTHDRDAGSDIENHITFGDPTGRIWETPVGTGLTGQHCQPIAVGGDRLVAAYTHRVDPPSICVALSEDFGRTWLRDTEFAVYESQAGTEPGFGEKHDFEDFWQDMMAWRFGHPRGVLLPNGELFIAFYGGDARAQSERWVRVGIEG